MFNANSRNNLLELFISSYRAYVENVTQRKQEVKVI